MKNVKTALFVIITIIGLSVLFYFMPLSKIIGNLPFVNKFYNNTSIEIVAKNGRARVWINGKEEGETPLTIEDLPQGEYTIELQRVSTQESFYEKHSFTVDLSKNTSARIDMEIGPNSLLHGTILYYTPIKMNNKGKAYLNVVSNVDGAKIYVDKDFSSTDSITNLVLNSGQYEISVTVSGYEDIKIPILLREGYQLNLKTYQFPVPVSYE